MSGPRSIIASALLSLLVAGCAPKVIPPHQAEAYSQEIQRHVPGIAANDELRGDDRIEQVWMALAFSNAPHCPSTVFGSGLSLASIMTGGDGSPPATMSTSIAAVPPLTPASSSGLHAGDPIASVDGIPFGPFYINMSSAYQRLQTSVTKGNAVMLTTTDGRSVSVQPTRQCDISAWVSSENGPAMYSAGKHIFVTQAALERLAPGDLAQLLAYELAHLLKNDASQVITRGALKLEPGKQYTLKAGQAIVAGAGIVDLAPNPDLALRPQSFFNTVLTVKRYSPDLERRAIADGARFAEAAGFGGSAAGLADRVRVLGIDTSYGRGLTDVEIEAAAREARR